MKKDVFSEILHTKVKCTEVHPSVTPIFQTSGFDADSEYFYARKSTPNSEELEEIFRKIEHSNYAITTTTGMTAIFMCFSLLKPGNRVLICNKIYGCSYKLFQKYAKQYDLTLDIFDLTDLEFCKQKITKRYDLCFFETPTNPFLESVSIREITDICKEINKDCIVVVDNTWATTIYQLPLCHGADISLYSGTKYLGGHTDVMCGVLTTNRDDLYQKLLEWRFYGGFILSPYSAWLIRRSMQTFKLRIEQQGKTTRFFAKELSKYPFIKKIYFPTIDGKQLVGYGGIIFIEVDDTTISRYAQILKKLTLFGTGTGMACVTSMIAQPYTGSHASLSEDEKAAMGISPNLLRLCFGLENQEDLLADFLSAFN